MFGRGRAQRKALREAARLLYGAVIDQARNPAFYKDFGVPDSTDGRFELLALHAFLIMRRLGRESGEAARAAGALSQQMFDLMFADMDQNLREMGAGDLGVGRRVKRMAKGFYGRVAAYDAALEGSREAQRQALRRNLYGTLSEEALPAEPVLDAMVEYLCMQAAALDKAEIEALLSGQVAFAGPRALG
ncbi:MAG: ubiquinol-cytochrome C chaperone family protein [Alphaproteobacteria bacterium]|nr:ubiquinol-cytochrome C chaperone family protein [Alphaproteobacteria bacterium]